MRDRLLHNAVWRADITRSGFQGCLLLTKHLAQYLVVTLNSVIKCISTDDIPRILWSEGGYWLSKHQLSSPFISSSNARVYFGYKAGFAHINGLLPV